MKKHYSLLASLLLASSLIGFAQPGVNIQWTVSCGTGDTSGTSPALSISGDTIYYANGTDGKLYAFNASDGTSVWNYNLEIAKSNPSRTGLAVGNNGVVYVPIGTTNTDPAYLYAINPNGTEQWKYTIGSGANITYVTPAITKDGDILVGNNGTDGALHLVDKATGTRKAYIKPSGGVLGSIVVSQDNVSYSQAGNSGFYAYNLNSIDADLAPTLLGNYKIDPSTNYYAAGSPAMDGDGNLLAAAGSGKVVSLHLTPTFDANWTYPSVANLSKIEQSGVAIGANGTLYIAGSENKKIFALNPDGTLKWEFATDGNAGSVPAIDNLGYIHFGDDAGNYYIIEDKTTSADQIYKAALSDGTNTTTKIWSAPAIANDGSIYLAGKTAGDIYLFKVNVTGVTGPANSYWAMKGGNAQRSGLQRSELATEPGTNISILNTEELHAFAGNKTIELIATQDGEISIYNLFGQLILKQWVNKGQHSFPVVSSQIYLVKLGDNTSKVIVQ
ncbi:outer membrane protein assembly factor BamB family protein [Viscerimonas tarda]|nr:hypothetical protein FACS189413_13470 [Bacteroidia bacterium]